MNVQTIGKVGAVGLAGVVTAGVVSFVAVLGAQIAAARRRPMVDARTAPDIGGTSGGDGPQTRLLILGDDLAVGVGVSQAEDSVAGRVAAALSKMGWNVETTSVAVAGSRTSDLSTQVSRALITSESKPHDVAVILVGALDATSRTPISEVSRSMSRAVTTLSGKGIKVVVATCPDLGAVRCTSFPLREAWARRSKRVAAAQEDVAVSAGATVVNAYRDLGPIFRADPGALCADGFHPAADGYRMIAEAMLPLVTSAVGDPSNSRR